MLEELDKARRTKGIAIVDIADFLGVRAQTVSDKINGVYDFKFGEAVKVQREFFPEYDIVHLFSGEDKTA